MWFWEAYEVVQCCGCKTIALAHSSSNSEDTDHEDVPREYEDVYPKPRMAKDGGRIGFLHDEVIRLPHEVQTVYRETEAAISNGMYVLAGMGIRAIVESVCADRGAKSDNLKKAINKLAGLNAVTEEEAEVLHRIRDTGNDAAHEFKPFTPRQIEAAMQVVDHLLIGTYIVNQEAKHLKQPKEKHEADGGKREP